MVHLLRYIRDKNNLVLEYYSKIEYAPLSNTLKQVGLNTENQLVVFSDSRWQDSPDTGRSTGEYIVFNQGGPIDHFPHVLVPVAQYSSESENNVSFAALMDLAHFRIINNDLVNKDPDVVPYQAPLIILDSNSAVCVDNNGKDIKQNRHISRRMHFVRNGEYFSMHKTV